MNQSAPLLQIWVSRVLTRPRLVLGVSIALALVSMVFAHAKLWEHSGPLA